MAHRTARSATLILVVLSASYLLNYVDRQLVVVAMEAIRRDFALNDAQLGLIAGMGFAIVYAVMGIPLAYIADQGYAAKVVTISTLVFSLMTSSCALAGSFGEFLLLRIGVAIGECGANPGSQAIISSLYKPDRRPRALAIYAFAVTLGMVCAFLFGGPSVKQFGWRATFSVCGAFGLVVAAALGFTLRGIDRRNRRSPSVAMPRGGTSLLAGILVLGGNRVFVLVTVATSFHMAAYYSAAQWLPSLLLRQHLAGIEQVGRSMALVYACTGFLGVLAFGPITQRLVVRDQRWYAWLLFLSAIISFPAEIAIYLIPPHFVGSTVAIGLYFCVAGIYVIPSYSLVQNCVAENERALAAAIFAFAISVISYGAGPSAVGALSAWIGQGGTAESLRLALFATTPLHFAAAILFLKLSTYLAAPAGDAKEVERVPVL